MQNYRVYVYKKSLEKPTIYPVDSESKLASLLAQIGFNEDIHDLSSLVMHTPNGITYLSGNYIVINKTKWEALEKIRQIRYIVGVDSK